MQHGMSAIIGYCMRVLGIDPGIGRTGWGVVEDALGSKVKVIAFGCIETLARTDLSIRIEQVFDGIIEIIDRYKPQAVSVEDLFFNTNASTALIVGQARGVVLLASAKHNIPVSSYTPLQVKIALTGYGRAEKMQVGKMVKVMLNLSEVPKPDDTADALAIGLTHLFSYKLKEK